MIYEQKMKNETYMHIQILAFSLTSRLGILDDLQHFGQDHYRSKSDRVLKEFPVQLPIFHFTQIYIARDPKVYDTCIAIFTFDTSERNFHIQGWSFEWKL